MRVPKPLFCCNRLIPASQIQELTQIAEVKTASRNPGTCGAAQTHRCGHCRATNHQEYSSQASVIPENAAIIHQKNHQRTFAYGKLLLDTKSGEEVFVYGNNEMGQLALENPGSERRFPYQTFSPNHCAVCTQNLVADRLWKETQVTAPNKPFSITDWAEVEGFRDQKVINIVGTRLQTLALTEDGRLFACGDEEFIPSAHALKTANNFRLAHGLFTQLQTGRTDFPVELPFTQSGQKVRDIGCSCNDSVVCITDAEEMFVWGSPCSTLVGSLTKDDTRNPVLQASKLRDVTQTPANAQKRPYE